MLRKLASPRNVKRGVESSKSLHLNLLSRHLLENQGCIFLKPVVTLTLVINVIDNLRM